MSRKEREGKENRIKNENEDKKKKGKNGLKDDISKIKSFSDVQRILLKLLEHD